MGCVKIWSQSERVKEVVSSRKSAPKRGSINNPDPKQYDAHIRTTLSMINGNRQVTPSPQLILQILNNLVRRAIQVLAMVWHIHSQEARRENGLPLRERCLALVQASRRTDFAQAGDETVERLGRTGDDKGLRSIVEGYVKLRILGEMLVRLLDMRLQILQKKSRNGQHGRRNALATLN
jgi:hypothetical protein